MFLAENWRMQNKFEETKFVFPNAPNIPITVNMGMRMPGCTPPGTIVSHMILI